MKTAAGQYAVSPAPDFVPRELWDREYLVNHSIPSSTRDDPAKGFALFSDLLGVGPGTTVLDLGCGNGRNAVYMAKKGASVTAVDFSGSALAATQRRASKAGMLDRIHMINRCLSSELPFESGSFDFILDSYLSCHFLNDRVVSRFWRESARLLKPNGHVLSLLFSVEDEYYAQFLPDKSSPALVKDPSNEIWKRLYDEKCVKTLFSADFRFVYFVKFEFDDVVFSKTYKRVIFVCVLQPL